MNRSHHCHAKLCKTRCRPQLLMCPKHWRMVPATLQRRVYATYRRGQCDDMRPSLDWHEAADAAIASVALQEGCPWRKLRVIEARALVKLHPSSLGDDLDDVRAELAKRDATPQNGVAG